MKLCFDSIEEVQEFVKKLKGTRKGKDDDEAPATGQAPPPMPPPVTGAASGFPGTSGFAPPAGGAGPASGFPAPGASAPVATPEALFVANKINPRLDQLIASGQDMGAMLGWFRAECSKVDPSAAGANMNQIKSTFLPKFQMPMLEHIAGLIGVQK